jgi:hypothetical protein
MSPRFLAYLRKEQDRLNRWVAGLTAVGNADIAELDRLRRLSRTVEQQIDRWASDLATTVPV